MNAPSASLHLRARQMNPSSLLAWSIFAVCAALTFTGAALFLVSRSASIPASFGTRDTAYINALGFLVMPLVGGLVVTKREAHPLGWIFCAIGLCMAIWAACDAYAMHALLISPDLPWGHLSAWLAGWIWIPGWGLAGFVFLLFPTGKLLSPRWRWEGRLLAVATTLVTLIHAVTPGDLRDYPGFESPISIDGFPLDNWQSGVLAVAVLAVCGSPCILALFLRLHRARGIQRQQIKWLVWAASLMLAIIGIRVVLAPLGFRERGLEAVSTLAAAGIPLAAGIAVLRYRLWDIDIIINRTIVYSILSTLLGGVYVGSIVLLQRLLGRWTSGSDLAISASTLTVAAMFRPALRRVQDEVDYRFYRRRYDAQRTVDAFRTRVQEQTDLNEVQTELLAVVHDTMQPEIAGVWIRPQAGVSGS